MQSNNPKVWMFQIAGVKFAQYKEAIEAGLMEGDILTLIAEPENEYGQTAVRIEWEGYKLGYVPKTEVELKRIMMGDNTGYGAKLSVFNPDEVTHRMFTVIVELP